MIPYLPTSGMAILSLLLVALLAWGVVSLIYLAGTGRPLQGLIRDPAPGDREIAALAARIAELERTGGSGTWMALFALRHHRRRLAELRRHARRQRRWWTELRGHARRIRLPGDLVPWRSGAIRSNEPRTR